MPTTEEFIQIVGEGMYELLLENWEEEYAERHSPEDMDDETFYNEFFPWAAKVFVVLVDRFVREHVRRSAPVPPEEFMTRTDTGFEPIDDTYCGP